MNISSKAVGPPTIHINNTYTHALVCVTPLHLLKVRQSLTHHKKFIATVTEDIDHVQNVPDPVSVSVSGSMDMHWYEVWISQLVVYESFTMVHLGGNIATLS